MITTIWGKGNSSKRLALKMGIKRNKPGDVIIRWKRLDFPKKSARIEFNKVGAIKLASHKYQSLQVMQRAGLDVPKYTKLRQVVEEDLDLYPEHVWFGRDFYHSKGADIEIFTGSNVLWGELGYRNYYIQYIKPKGEYRYHVAFGKVILCTKKMLAEGEEDNSLIRNFQNGKWRQVVCENTQRFSDACIKAVNAHGLDFGAVDFINYKGKPHILEVNTAPGLEMDNRLEAYANAFKEKINDL